MPPNSANEVEDVRSDRYTPVAEIFAEGSVLVTGATGFLGKALVEKLLRSCPGVKHIYLLMRPKRGRGVQERLTDIFDSAIFDVVKKEQASALNKIIPIQGDIGEPDLGISLADQETLTRNVSFVFHSAATLKLNEPMKVAIQVNLLGTKRVLDLCRRMPGLKAMVHVSTCYSNSDLKEIDEVVYPPTYDPEGIMQCVKWMDDDTLEKVTPILLGTRPNTYIFTKALAESVIAKEGAGLPTAIVRPTLITPTWKEPMPGWLEGINGPTGVIAAYGKGMLRTLHCDANGIVDLVPVDLVVNLMICAAWRASTQSKDQTLVYNSCSGVTNPVKYGESWRVVGKTIRSNPPQNVVWYPPVEIYRANKYIYQLSEIFLHILPAYSMDFLRRLLQKEPMLVRLDEKIRQRMLTTVFVMTSEWRFDDTKTINLNKCLSEEDQQIFYTDISGLDWESYIEEYTMGVRRHIHNEHLDTLPQSRKWFNRLLWIKRASKLLSSLLLLNAVIFMFF